MTRSIPKPIDPDPRLHTRLRMPIHSPIPIPIPIHNPISRPIQQRTLTSDLLRRRHIERGILIKKVHRHQSHPQNLARHDGEILHTRHMLQPKLHPHNHILVHHVILAVRPRAHPLPAAGLIRVFPACVQLAVAVSGDVEIVVGELGALVVEGFRVRDHFLEIGRLDLVRDCLAINWVQRVRVADLVGAVGGGVQVQACGVGDFALAHRVADGVRIEVGFLHGEDFGGEDGVAGPVDAGVDAQAEDVLVVGGEDAWVDDGTPGDGDAGVDGLRADDSRGADFIAEFASLVEDEGEDVFVVGHCDDGLQDEFAGARDGGPVGAVVGVFPANPGVLLVDADDVVHG